MATITLSYTVSAADQTRVVAAFQTGANADLGSIANASQVLDYIKKVVKQEIINKTKNFEKAAAIAAIVPSADPILT